MLSMLSNLISNIQVELLGSHSSRPKRIVNYLVEVGRSPGSHVTPDVGNGPEPLSVVTRYLNNRQADVAC